MKLKAKEYYKILHFLEVETMDRFYPVEEYFYSVDQETGEEVQVPFVGDSFLFQTNRETFVGFDYVEVLLESSVAHSISDIHLNLSEYIQGYDPIAVLDADGTGQLPVDTPKKLVFRVRKSQTMSETSRNYTNIKSIEIVTPNNIDFTIYDVCFRDLNAMFSLEQLDEFYEDGKYYVLSRLHMEDVPVELADHVFTASAGYAWMSVWEYESRVMKDTQKNAKNYGQWLFATVDEAIELYKKANGISDDDEMFVLDELVTYKSLRW